MARINAETPKVPDSRFIMETVRDLGLAVINTSQPSSEQVPDILMQIYSVMRKIEDEVSGGQPAQAQSVAPAPAAAPTIPQPAPAPVPVQVAPAPLQAAPVQAAPAPVQAALPPAPAQQAIALGVPDTAAPRPAGAKAKAPTQTKPPAVEPAKPVQPAKAQEAAPKGTRKAAVAAPSKPVPAVPIEQSIQPDGIICLEDGKKQTMMKRYLASRYGMTPEEYRAKWGLPKDYPMTAPSYSGQKSEFSKVMGLGIDRRGGLRRDAA